jgi:hypothetical protein
MITDIAHSLSLQCRYNGHTAWFYSVAQHCWLLSLAVPDHLKRCALLHDAAEAYIGDLILPLKSEMPEFRQWDDLMTRTIFERFDIDYGLMEEFSQYDRGISIDEMKVLMHKVDPTLDKYKEVGVNIQEMSPRTAFNRYLQRFQSLWPNEWPNVA